MTLPFPVKKGKPGAARVEYRACREDVEAMLAQGYTARTVYEHMKNQGRMTCSYSAFCDYVRGGGKRKHTPRRSKRQAQLQASPLVPQQTGPRIIRHESKPFVHPGEIDPQTLF
jgi:hypothetical protein